MKTTLLESISLVTALTYQKKVDGDLKLLWEFVHALQ